MKVSNFVVVVSAFRLLKCKKFIYCFASTCRGAGEIVHLCASFSFCNEFSECPWNATVDNEEGGWDGVEKCLIKIDIILESVVVAIWVLKPLERKVHGHFFATIALHSPDGTSLVVGPVEDVTSEIAVLDVPAVAERAVVSIESKKVL